MQRRQRVKHIASFEDGLAYEAHRFKERAKELPPDFIATTSCGRPAGRDRCSYQRAAFLARLRAEVRASDGPLLFQFPKPSERSARRGRSRFARWRAPARRH